MPIAVQCRLGDDEQPGPAQAFPAEHRLQVGADLGFSGRRHPVQHHGHRDVAGGRVQQQPPGHGVGVAVGGGDKHPEVGRGQQLPGELAVVGGDGVDVGSVQQRDSLRHRRIGDQHQRGDRGRVGSGAGLAGRQWLAVHGAADPAQAREDPLVLEPATVGGVVQQDGLARGGTDGAGAGDGVPDERVDEG